MRTSSYHAAGSLRLVIIICAYLLFRPYLVKLGAKLQERDLQRQDKIRNDTQAESDIVEAERETSSLAWGATTRIRRKIAENKAAAETNDGDSDDEANKIFEDE